MESHKISNPTDGDIHSAERTIRILGQRKRLRPHEQSRLEQAKGVIQRAREITVEEAEEKLNPEGSLQTLIQRTEQGFSHFAESARDKLRRYVEVEHVRGMLEIPLELLEYNARNNDVRNMMTFRRTNQPFSVENPMFDVYHLSQHGTFLYGKHKSVKLHSDHAGVHGTACCYMPTERTLYLQRDIDPSNVFDMLGVYHELVHVGQDNAVRNRMTDELAYTDYVFFHMIRRNEREKTFIDNEWIAYAFELELMNAMLDNKLRHLPSDELQVKRLLNIDVFRQEADRRVLPGNSNLTALPANIHLIPHYFPHGNPMQLPRSFCSEVNDQYAHKDLHMRGENQRALMFPELGSADTPIAKRVCFLKPQARL